VGRKIGDPGSIKMRKVFPLISVLPYGVNKSSFPCPPTFPGSLTSGKSNNHEHRLSKSFPWQDSAKLDPIDFRVLSRPPTLPPKKFTKNRQYEIFLENYKKTQTIVFWMVVKLRKWNNNFQMDQALSPYSSNGGLGGFPLRKTHDYWWNNGFPLLRLQLAWSIEALG